MKQIPKSVRERLAEDATSEEVYQLMRTALEDALNQTRPFKITHPVTCKHCSRQMSYEFVTQVADSKARLEAIQLWLNQGLGTPKQTVALERGMTFDDIITMPEDQKQVLRAKLVDIVARAGEN